ncbi:hypothetical protein MMC13_004903 [Lambiella insularis]|nr:hypothetical protein [Lambiella insularis]
MLKSREQRAKPEARKPKQAKRTSEARVATKTSHVTDPAPVVDLPPAPVVDLPPAPVVDLPPAPIVDLPLELVNLVIANLHDLGDLKALMLTCRSISTACRATLLPNLKQLLENANLERDYFKVLILKKRVVRARGWTVAAVSCRLESRRTHILTGAGMMYYVKPEDNQKVDQLLATLPKDPFDWVRLESSKGAEGPDTSSDSFSYRIFIVLSDKSPWSGGTILLSSPQHKTICKQQLFSQAVCPGSSITSRLRRFLKSKVLWY